MSTLQMLAVDFGASSGRGILGRYDGKRLSIQEVHRFSNDPVQLGYRLHWDYLRLFHELTQTIQAASLASGDGLSSIAIDTWGVDYGMVDGQGELLGNPVHYRDARHQVGKRQLLRLMNESELYARSGIQPLAINTICQLSALQTSHWSGEVQLLFMPDLFRYYLCGDLTTEYTIASTSGLLDPWMKDWNEQLLGLLPVSSSVFSDVIMPGTMGSSIRQPLAERIHIPTIPVIAAASHDTASAVVAVPSTEEEFVFLSCGTWSLMGVQLDSPVVNEDSRKLGFTNEGGAFGKTRLLKNITGLWLLQECRRQWELDGDALSYEQMQELALSEQSCNSFIDTQGEEFLQPGHMPQRIQRFCHETGQRVPQTKGEIIRTVIESLAMTFKQTLEEIEGLIGRPMEVIHMVGGGIQNRVLCQFTANAAGRTVITGPTEATAIGNMMMQAVAHGEVNHLSEIRQIVSHSFPPETIEPEDIDHWKEKYQSYRQALDHYKIRS